MSNCQTFYTVNIMNPYRLISIIPPLVLTIFGLVLCYYGFMTQQDNSQLDAFGVRVKGTVVDINEKGIYRSPFVEFQTLDGKKITFLSKLEVNQDMFNYEIGQEVDVIYPKDNPQSAVIDAFVERNFVQLFVGILGIVLLLIAYFINRHFSKKAAQY